MEWRNLIDMKLGFGGLRLPIKGEKEDVDHKKMCEMVDEYVANGGKYFDTSYIYHRGMSEPAMAACVVERLPRDSFYLADKLPSWGSRGKGSLEEVFQDQLRKCHVDYFDFYLLHNISCRSLPYVEEHDSFSFLMKLKERGDIRYAGFSFHDTPQMLDKLLTEHKDVDFVQLQLNYYDWLSDYVNAKKCYEVAVRHNKPVTVMETVRGGGLASLPEEAVAILEAVAPGMSPASLAIRFAASLDHVMMVLSGMTTLEQVQDNCSYMRADAFRKLSDAEYEAVDQIRNIIRAQSPIACAGCGKCEEACPKDIPIAKAFSIYNDGKVFGEMNFPIMHYEIHMENHDKAGACNKCGACLGACPNGVDIPAMLGQVAQAYDPKD